MLFLFGKRHLQKIGIKPLPEIAVLPGNLGKLMMIPFAVKTIAAHEKSLIAVNIQNKPFYGLFDRNVILGGELPNLT